MLDPFALLFPIFIALFVAVFVLIFFVIFAAILNNIRIAVRNRASPLLAREASIIAKRQHISGGGLDSSASTTYYVTFEFASGTREEFNVRDRDYGLLAEGDRGTLHSQGTWYKGFQRL